MTTVMVIEDQPDVSWLHSRVLTDAGLDVRAMRRDFERALDSDTWVGVDVAVVDIMLGEPVSGREILRYLKTYHPTIKRVVSSALNEAQDLALADVYLRKPHSLDTLVAAVRG